MTLGKLCRTLERAAADATSAELGDLTNQIADNFVIARQEIERLVKPTPELAS